MLVYHQTGFRDKWNIDSYNSGIGDGIIFSPVNIDADKLLQTAQTVKETGFLDPQLYLLNEAKGTLDTYPYFPANIKTDFTTTDLDTTHDHLAKACADFQKANNFRYLVIPTRYYDENPSGYFIKNTEYFVEPFVTYARTHHPAKKILLSVIVKPSMLTDEYKRNELLNWITGMLYIDGVYIIFENSFTSKQIKDFDYLFQALQLIHTIKQNGLEVVLGYCNTEAILYGAAMPDAVTVGSYENLRSFAIKRFQEVEGGPMRGPNARLYSSKLFQWIDYEYVQAMKRLLPGYEQYFDDSEYRPLMFQPDYKWHFTKPEPYKHYFKVFDQQVENLPGEQGQRITFLKKEISNAVLLFKAIQEKVLLDDDSSGSHLPTWYNVLNAFEETI